MELLGGPRSAANQNWLADHLTQIPGDRQPDPCATRWVRGSAVPVRAVFEKAFQGFKSGHSGLNSQVGGGLTDLGDLGRQQIFGFTKRTLGSTPANGDRHLEVTRDSTIVDAAAQDAPIGMDGTVLALGPLIATAQRLAFGRLDHFLTHF